MSRTNSDVDEEELQLDYEDACNLVAELEQELRAERLQAQELHLRLQAVDIKERLNSSGSDIIGASSEIDMVEQEQKIQDICDTFHWIVEYVDVSESTILTVGCEVPLGRRYIHFQEVVQWPMSGAPWANLRVTVAIEHRDEFVELLRIAKAKDGLGSQNLRHRLAENWELVPGEISPPTCESPEPAVLLAHRTTSAGILVAAWPTLEALEDFKLVYAPAGHIPSVGDRVEILYHGEWYLGSLHSLDAVVGSAAVQCDVDGPDIYTVVPLSHVRHFTTPSAFARGHVTNMSALRSDS